MITKRVVGKNVAAERARKALTQNELAQRVNVSRPIIIQIEQGKHPTTVDLLDRLAESLGVTVAYLVTPWKQE